MECDLGSIRVYYEVFGAGRPLVILHGWTVDHTFMVQSLEPLFTSRQVWQRIYLDLPGRGKTAPAPEIVHQDQMLQLVLDFIDRVIPNQHFSLAGLSYGGYLARAVLSRRMASMDGLLLIVPVIRPDPDQRALPPFVTFTSDPALLAELPAELAANFSESVVVQSRPVLDRFVGQVLPAMAHTDRDYLTQLRQNYRFSFDVDRLPEPFAAPTLFLLGKYDVEVGYRDAWQLIDNYPRGAFVLLDRAGHLLPIEQEELYLALISEWLDRVAEYSTPHRL